MPSSNEKNGNEVLARPVDIQFDCQPLRSMTRLDPPLDASPGLVAKYERIKQAIAEHGMFNTYYLHNASCKFYVTNDPTQGMIAFKFEGVVFTDSTDSKAKRAKLDVVLEKETCSWLEQRVVNWFTETVTRAVVVEFDRYIGAGDSEQTKQRMEQLEKSLEAKGGYLGMGL
jgi:hypothetical protein